MKKIFTLLMILASLFIVSCENETPSPASEVFDVKLIVSGSDIREYKVKDGETFSFPKLEARFDDAVAHMVMTDDDRGYFLDEKPVITEDTVFSVLWSNYIYTISDDGILAGIEGNGDVLAIPHMVDGKEIKGIGNEIMKGHGDVSRVYVQNGIETIGDMAFKCNNLVEIQLPPSVVSVGKEAFSCPQLMRIVIDGPVLPDWGKDWNGGFLGTIITAGEFMEQDGIVYAKVQDEGETVLTVWDYNGKWIYVTIPSSVNGIPVRSIASGAFKNDEIVRSITVSEGIESIGSKAFYESSIKYIELPSTLKKLEPYALAKMTYVKELVLPDNLKVLPEYALYLDNNLLKLVLPANLEVIESRAFNYTGESDLELVIPDKVKRIDSYAFQRCFAKRIELPEGLSLHATNIFDQLVGYQTISFATRSDEYGSDGGWDQNCSANFEFRDDFKTSDGFIFGYTPDSKLMLVDMDADKITEDVTIPEKAVDPNGRELPVVAIGNSIFEGNTIVKKVTIPQGVASIGSSIFHNCTNLANVDLPEGLKEIPDSAFEGCGITSITIPSTVTTIGDNAFKSTEISSITIPASVKTIGSEAFAYIYQIIPSIEFAADSQLETMGKQVFFNTWIKEMALPAGLKVIPSGAFNSCQKLEKLTLPSKLEVIESDAFKMCTLMNLTDYKLPATLKRIEPHAFLGTYGIKNLIIPSTVEYVGFNVFEGWKNDQQLTVEKNDNYVSWALEWADSCNAQVNNKNV